ncbi:MAG: PBP1A family penicillin-binding protein, partial [Clostridium sp.]|uniref:transglycosylase domain-containing protein n=1 Tax=Clostridium sp. TaxID=1506 RepID=UPI002FCCB477
MDQKNSEKKPSTKKKSKKKKRSIGKTILIGFLISLLILAGAGAGVAVAVIKSAPDIDSDILSTLNESSMMYDMNGKPFEKVAGDENRFIVNLNEIPKDLQNAFIAIEDERFYSHSGIDVKRIFGALFHNFKTMSKSQGASTITQQLIKNIALSPEKKITRKLQEMYLSLQLERKLSKDQILEAYLNTIFLGGRDVCGVQSASLHYFGKSVKELDLAESALIAGLTQNPAKYYPYSEKNKKDPTAYLNRQHTVLGKMLENGYITQSQHDEAVNKKLAFVNKKPVYTAKYQWFVEPALDQVEKDIAEKQGISIEEAEKQVANGGYSIHLTIDPELQLAAQKVVDNPKYYSGISVPSKYKNYSPNGKDGKSQPQAAAAIYDYKTGQMRAIIGGRGEHEAGSFNRALTERQPGSTIKPLSTYAPALDKNIVTSVSTINGAKLSPGEAEGFSPKNAANKQYGTVTIKYALVESINTATVRLTAKIGKRTSIDYLKNKFHLSTVVDSGAANDVNYAALSLGGMTKGVLATEMAAAFGVFGNNGMYTEPIMYTKVLDRDGNVVIENESVKSQSLSSTASFMTLDMLRSVVQSGTGGGASFGGMPVAGKTGTTTNAEGNNTTGWFVGLTPYYSGAVWIGHDKPSVSLSKLTSGSAARLWAGIMKEAHRGKSYKDFSRPAGFVSVAVCPDSGKLPTEYCTQAGVTPVNEYFPSSSQPSEICDVHVGPPVPELPDPEITPPVTPPPVTPP